jgi:hypothetical protein
MGGWADGRMGGLQKLITFFSGWAGLQKLITDLDMKRDDVVYWYLMIVLLLFLQKQNLAYSVYQFGSVLSLPD